MSDNIVYAIVRGGQEIATFQDEKEALAARDYLNRRTRSTDYSVQKKQMPRERYGIVTGTQTVWEGESNFPQHHPEGLANWREVKRAMEFHGPSGHSGHIAQLKFGDITVPLTKNYGDLQRLYKWCRNHLGNNQHYAVYSRLGNLQQLNTLVTSIRPPQVKREDVNESEYRRPSSAAVNRVLSQISKQKTAKSPLIWQRPNQISGSHSDRELSNAGLVKSKTGSWGGTQAQWDRLYNATENFKEDRREESNAPRIRRYKNSYGRDRWEVLDWRGRRVIEFDSLEGAKDYLKSHRVELSDHS